MPFPQCSAGNNYLEISSEEELAPDSTTNRDDPKAEAAGITHDQPIDNSDEDIDARVNISEDSEYRLRGGQQHLWGAHRGHGDCMGSNQLKCYFGSKHHPAKAGPNGRCDFCSSDSLAALTSDPRGQARITYLLKHVEGKSLQHAYVRIKLVLGEAAMHTFEWRERALYRSSQRRQATGTPVPYIKVKRCLFQFDHR